MTECNQSSFGFEASGRREIVARFDGGTISSDGGAFLLRETDKRLNLLPRLAECFLDGRNQNLIAHTIQEMLSQRVYGLALGYEDINDHEQLRNDPVFGILAGREALEEPLAGKSTLNRMELGTGTHDRYKRITFWKEAMDELLVKVFIESHGSAPGEIVLDVDTTDLPLHGKQEGRFFHGYYDNYCYLPLYVFCGDQLLIAKLRKADIDASAGAADEIARVIGQIRARWPKVRIVVRADSGFAREELMAWCEANDVEFLLGLAQNSRLNAELAPDLAAAAEASVATGEPARRFKDFKYSTLDSWSRERRVIGKAEWMTPSVAEAADATQRRKKKKAKKARKAKADAPPPILLPGRANPRFIVTSLKAEDHEARALYEKRYCARGEAENHIKECQLDLFADRTSSHTMRANQLRLWLSSLAYALMCALRRIGLTNTRLADATCGTIRLKLFKIGALVKTSFRRILFSMASAFPYCDAYAAAWSALQSAA